MCASELGISYKALKKGTKRTENFPREWEKEKHFFLFAEINVHVCIVSL